MARTPLYQRIERELRARLAQARPGDVVPAESMLAEEFGVARMTVRAALNALEADGLIERIQGRGTFVRQRPTPRAAGTLMSFHDQVRGWGRTPSSRLVEAELRAARAAEAAALQLAAAVAALQNGGNGLNPINAVRHAVGLDRLRIVPADPQTGQGTSVAAGKYITRRLYAEIVTDGQGYSATQVEFQVTRWLSLLSSISTLGRESANVRVSKDY